MPITCLKLISRILAYISYGIQCFLFCFHGILNNLTYKLKFNSYPVVASTESPEKGEDKVTEIHAMKALVHALKSCQQKVKATQNENAVLKKEKRDLVAVILSNLSSNADSSGDTVFTAHSENKDKPQCDPTSVDKFRSELVAARTENSRLTNQLKSLQATHARTKQLNEAKILILTEMKAALESQVALLEAK